jgi:hypothetical protein
MLLETTLPAESKSRARRWTMDSRARRRRDAFGIRNVRILGGWHEALSPPRGAVGPGGPTGPVRRANVNPRSSRLPVRVT